MSPALNIAIRAARAAGDIIIKHIDRIVDMPVTTKGHNDFVTEVDRWAETAIIQTLQRSYPAHAILSEEQGQQGDSPWRWIIDPLDGTTNYIHGFPQYAVAIALQHHKKLEQAVVYDPLRQELFTTSRGRGAMLNNKRIRVSNQHQLKSSLIGTGSPFKTPQRQNEYFGTFREIFSQVCDIRRTGAASLDLAYIACGRLDGFWELGLKPWDIAAGALLVQESGGLISDLNGGDNYLQSGNIIATTPKIHKTMITILSS